MSMVKEDLSLGKINHSETVVSGEKLLGFFADDYIFTCFRDINSDISTVYIVGEDDREMKSASYEKLCEILCERVHPQDLGAVMDLITPDRYTKLLVESKCVSEYFRWKGSNGYTYHKLELRRAEALSEPLCTVFIGASCVDDAMRQVIEHDEMVKRYESGIYALSREFTSVYYVNLDTGEVVPYNLSNRIEGMFGDKFYRMNYNDAVKAYIDSAVLEDDKAMMTEILSTEYLKKQIEKQSIFTRIYLNNENRYTVMKCVRIDNEERDNIVVMGFGVCDEEIRVDMERKKNNELYMSLLDGLSREYDSVWLIHSDRTMELFRASNSIPDMKNVKVGIANPNYDDAIRAFTNSAVISDDKESMMKAVCFETLLEKVLDEGVYSVTFKYDRGNRTFGYHQVCFAKAVGMSGDVNFVMGFRNVDAAIREQLSREERYMSAVMQRDMDGLTGINNRYCYEQRIETYPNSNYERIGCIYIDVNGLHEMNNLNGHDAGDELIKYVADSISGTWGRDNCFRIGGDEFVAFAFDCTDSQIKQDVADLRKRIAEAGYSASVGSSSAAVEGLSMRQLIKSAERSMYTDKRKYYSGVLDRRATIRTIPEES